MKQNIIIAGGGTGGHISPAISIAKSMEKLGYSIIYVGNKNSMEERIAKKNGFDFYAINVQKLYRKFTFKHFLFPFKLLFSVKESIGIISEKNTVAFIGTGGFVSGPVGYAAKLMRIPIFLHEQNSFPGLTTRKLSKYANAVFLGNEGAKKYFKKKNVIVSGNPINPEESILPKNEILKHLDFSKENKTIFLIGGSQGSKILNDIMEKSLDAFLKQNLNIIWQVGRNNRFLIDKYSNKKNLHVFDFSYEINKFYKIADLMISRAGALTLTEIEYFKVPSILIPYSYAAGNHQYYNALEMKEKGVSELISENDLSHDKLREKVNLMLENIEKYKNGFGKIKDASKIISGYIDNSLKRLNW